MLHVLDASSPRVDEERRVASEVLAELGVSEEKVLPVWNKRDLPGAFGPPGAVRVSAATGAGIDDLERAIVLRARPETARMRLAIPYADGRAISAARARCRVIGEKDRGDALVLDVAGERARLGALTRYLVEDERGRGGGGGLRRRAGCSRKTTGEAFRLPPLPELPCRHSLLP